MKKIFAIALALVMVLSMASAFAAFCVTPDWSCAADVCNLGKATVEVVPYVVANDCDGKSASYVQSDCAAAVYGQKVYFAVKMNVPADINTEWFDKSALDVKFTGLNPTDVLDLTGYIATIKAHKDFGKKALTFYLANYAGKVVDAASEGFDINGLVFDATVTNAKTAKVCAVLTSELPSLNNIKVGDYYVTYVKGSNITVHNGKVGTADFRGADFMLNSSDKIEYVDFYYGATPTKETFSFDDGANFITYDATNKVATKGYGCAPYNWLKTAMNNFKFDFRTTCYTEKAFEANFGWDDEVKACFTWSDKAMSVVDAECVVAIPKTGDASVLAWLF